MTEGTPAFDAAEAARLLAQARVLRWRFPTSFGRPIGRDDPDGRAAEQAASERARFADAARDFLASGKPEEAVEIAARTWRLWLIAGDLDGGRAFLSRVLDAAAAITSVDRALVCYGDALLAARLGAHDDARERSEESYAVATASADRTALLFANLALSRTAFEAGAYSDARDYAAEARRLATGLEPAHLQAPLHMLAQAVRAEGDHESAAHLFGDSLELNRRIGDEGMVSVELHNLGHVESRRGRVPEAAALFAELRTRTSPEDAYDQALQQINEAALALAQHDNETAGRLLAQARSALRDANLQLAPDDQNELEWLEKQVTDIA